MHRLFEKKKSQIAGGSGEMPQVVLPKCARIWRIGMINQCLRRVDDAIAQLNQAEKSIILFATAYSRPAPQTVVKTTRGEGGSPKGHVRALADTAKIGDFKPLRVRLIHRPFAIAQAVERVDLADRIWCLAGHSQLFDSSGNGGDLRIFEFGSQIPQPVRVRHGIVIQQRDDLAR